MGKRCALIDMDDDKSDLYKWAIQSELLSEHVYQFTILSSGNTYEDDDSFDSHWAARGSGLYGLGRAVA